MAIKLPFWTLIIGILLSACTASGGFQPITAVSTSEPVQRTLTIFAAASLTEAFEEIAARFQAENPRVEVAFNFAGSQQLAQQLAQGAPGDVFASSSPSQMQAAEQAGRIAAGRAVVFANNRLVVVMPKDNPFDLRTLQDLTKPSLKLILAAETVPIGQYSLEFLEKASQDPAFGVQFKESVLNNTVSYEETVRAVLSKVLLGEADAGIVYISDVSSIPVSEVSVLEIPDKLNVVASYPIAPLSDAGQPRLADEFIALVLSPTGQQIMAKYGFIPVK